MIVEVVKRKGKEGGQITGKAKLDESLEDLNFCILSHKVRIHGVRMTLNAD